MDKINILSKYKEFEAIWSPHSIAELNNQQVLLVAKGTDITEEVKKELGL